MNAFYNSESKTSQLLATEAKGKTKSNFAFEKIQRAKLCKELHFFSEQLGASDYQWVGNRLYDSTIIIDGVKYKVEEKYRKGLWDDILIEIMQHCHPVLNQYELGWYAMEVFDFFVYTWSQCPEDLDKDILDNWEPIRSIVIKPWSEFKMFFAEHETLFKIQVSVEGYGTTVNRIVPVKLIPQDIIKMFDFSKLEQLSLF